MARITRAFHGKHRVCGQSFPNPRASCSPNRCRPRAPKHIHDPPYQTPMFRRRSYAARQNAGNPIPPNWASPPYNQRQRNGVAPINSRLSSITHQVAHFVYPYSDCNVCEFLRRVKFISSPSARGINRPCYFNFSGWNFKPQSMVGPSLKSIKVNLSFARLSFLLIDRRVIPSRLTKSN